MNGSFALAIAIGYWCLVGGLIAARIAIGALRRSGRHDQAARMATAFHRWTAYLAP